MSDQWCLGYGPGLQPNQKDLFGYLQAVKNVTMGGPCRNEFEVTTR